MSTKAFLNYSPQRIVGNNFVPAYQLERFKPHRHRVLNLYKNAYRALEVQWKERGWLWVQNKDKYNFCYERTLLRARFDTNKSVTNLAKATELLKGNTFFQDFLEFSWIF